MSEKEANNDESDGGEEGIHERDDRLCLEDKAESFPDPSSKQGILIIEKTEVPVFHTEKEVSYFFSLDDKNIGENQSDQKFHHDDTTIGDMSEEKLSHSFDVFWIDEVIGDLDETEIQSGIFLEVYRKFGHLSSHIWRTSHEIPDIRSDLWEDVHEYDHYDRDKEDVEEGDDRVRRGIFLCDTVSTILVSLHSPLMDLRGDEFPDFEKDIGTDEGDEEESEKIRKPPTCEPQEAIGDDLFPENFREDDDPEVTKRIHRRGLEDFMSSIRESSTRARLEDAVDTIGVTRESLDDLSEETFCFWGIDPTVVPLFGKGESEYISFDAESRELQIGREGCLTIVLEVIDEFWKGEWGWTIR